ncbi:MAG: hypothetical protein VB099_01115 [Candidatus Limiplasma sp.]|nr:hypothetical protein [Candidatus Limiplasma sp.]
MTTWQAMHRLEELGYSFELTEAGKVRAVLMGTKPPEASALLDIARADYVRQRVGGAAVCAVERPYSLRDALAIGRALKAGVGQLMGKVHYDGQAIRVTWTGPDLASWVALAQSEARAEMRRMDESEFWNVEPEEYEQMCIRYGLLAEVAG